MSPNVNVYIYVAICGSSKFWRASDLRLHYLEADLPWDVA